MKKGLLLCIAVVFVISYSNILHAEKTSGVTGNTVKIGCVVDLTGPSSFPGRGANIGAETYFSHINDQGGVNGRKIKYLVEDNTYQPATAVAAFKKLIHRDGIFAVCFSWGTVTTLATANSIKRSQTPTIYYGNSEAIFNPPRHYLFSYQTSNYSQGQVIANYIVNTLKSKELKFGSIYQDDEFGRSSLRGFKDSAKTFGAEWVGEQHYKRGAISFTSQLLAMKKTGCTHLFLGSIPREGASILREAGRIGWSPNFYGNSAMTINKLLELSGNSAEGYIGVSAVLGWNENNDAVKKVKDIILKYRKNLDGLSNHTLMAWAGAMLMTEGINKAGKNLTTNNLIGGLEAIKGFNPDGLISPITWGPNQRDGGKGVRIIKADVEKKALVPISGWMTSKMK